MSYFNGYFNDFGYELLTDRTPTLPTAPAPAPALQLAMAHINPALIDEAFDRTPPPPEQTLATSRDRVATRVAYLGPTIDRTPESLAVLSPIETDIVPAAPPAGGGSWSQTPTGASFKIGSQLALPQSGGGAFQSPGAALPGTTSGPAPIAQSGAGAGAGAAAATCAAATGILNAVPCSDDPTSCCCPPGMAPNAAGNLCVAPAGAAGGGAGMGSVPLIAGAAVLAMLLMRR